jgi:hypothetical protein
MKISETFLLALRDHSPEINRLIGLKPDWDRTCDRFNQFWNHVCNPDDPVWSRKTMELLSEVYFFQRDRDNGMSNITLRTLAGMPQELRNPVKLIFLQIAEACTFFNATHKVNFEPEELPADHPGIKMIPGKVKGMMTFANPLPALYPKTSLTFDYWVPKILEWTVEVRQKQLTEWKGKAILRHESCTDFMRISLMFLSDAENYPPIAKSEDREALLLLMGRDFIWLKKSAKREDILLNSMNISAALQGSAAAAGMHIPLESWSRILPAPFMKSLLKS